MLVYNVLVNRKASYPHICEGRELVYNFWDENSIDRLVVEIFDRQDYGKPFLDLPLDVVVDLGANIGMASIYFYDRAKIIHAIEPYTKNYECLELNIKENGLDKIKPHKVAITTKEGEVEMYTPSDQLGTKIRTTQADPEGLETVNATTLIKFLDDNNIDKVDLLKADIEGEEKNIFTEESMKLLRPRIKNFIGEHTPSAVAMSGYDYGFNEGGHIWYAKS